MNVRFTAFCRRGLFRLRNCSCYRSFSIKKANHQPVAAPKRWNNRFSEKDRALLLNYINLYMGDDTRLSSHGPTMNKVLEVRKKLGPFKSVDDLVDVVGLPESEATDLSKKIVKFLSRKISGVRLSYPPFTATDRLNVKSVLAIHSTLSFVSWAHLDISGRVDQWSQVQLSLGEKLHPIDSVRAVMRFSDKIPHADAYFFEAPEGKRSKNTLSEMPNTNQLGNINTSILTAIACLHSKDGMDHRFYYLKRHLVPLLFNLYVGRETVTRFRVVEELINSSQPYLKEYGPVFVDEWLRDAFSSSINVKKEYLSIPLLAAITAMELLVRQNPDAINKVTQLKNETMSKVMRSAY